MNIKKYFSFATLLFASMLAFGARFYVSQQGSDLNDGSTWSSALADIQTAIDKASAATTDGDIAEIWVAKGTYKHGAPIKMANNVHLYGSFSGAETSPSERDIFANRTIISGENLYRVISNDFTAEKPLTKSAIMDGFEISRGSAQIGAGVYNTYASPIFTNCVFADNMVFQDKFGVKCMGGAIVNENFASPHFQNCIFARNTIGIGEGIEIDNENGIFNNGNNTLVWNDFDWTNTSSDLTDIKITLTPDSNIYFPIASCVYVGGNSSPSFANCFFNSNKSNSNFSFTAVGSTFQFEGHDIYISSKSTCEVLNCTFINSVNSICLLDSSTLKVANSVFAGNIGDSADILSNNSTIIASNCLMTAPCAGTNISNAPSFVLPLGFYYNAMPIEFSPLAERSPAIGAGLTQSELTQLKFSTPLPTNDIFGNPRTVPTLGAYNFYPNLVLNKTLSSKYKYVIGDDMTICAYASSTDSTYQWYKNGTPIDGAIYADYLENPQETATYTAKITTPDGTVYDTAPLLVTVLPKVIYVAQNGDDANDGYSWQKAKRTLNGANDIAIENNEIWIGFGRYENTSVELVDGISVYGSFKGDETAISQRTSMYRTVLAGQKYLGYKKHSVISLSKADAKIDGIVFANAIYGLYLQESSRANVSNCVFFDAPTFNSYSTLKVSNTLFDQNPSPAVSNSCAIAEFVCSTFINAAHISTYDSNPLYLNNGSSDVSIIHCTISDSPTVKIQNFLISNVNSPFCAVNSTLIYAQEKNPDKLISNDDFSINIAFSFDMKSTFLGDVPMETWLFGGLAENLGFTYNAGEKTPTAVKVFMKNDGTLGTLPQFDANNIPYTDENRAVGACSKTPLLGIGVMRQSYYSRDGKSTVFEVPSKDLLVSTCFPFKISTSQNLLYSDKLIFKNGTFIGYHSIPLMQSEEEAVYYATAKDSNGKECKSPEILIRTKTPLVCVAPEGDDLNDGTSWQNPKKTLNAAMEAAIDGSVIWIKEGTYTLSESVKMKQNVAILGGFKGNENSYEERVSGARTILTSEKGCDFILEANYSLGSPLSSAASLNSLTFANASKNVIKGTG